MCGNRAFGKLAQFPQSANDCSLRLRFSVPLKWQVFGGLAERGGVRSLDSTHAFHSFVMMDRRVGWSIRTFVEHDKVISYHFGSEFLISFLVFPASRPK